MAFPIRVDGPKLLVLFTACVALIVGGCAGREPSQADLASTFRSHRSEFERLRLLVNERPVIVDVGGYGKSFFGETGHQKVGPIHPLESRASEIGALMRGTGIETLMNGRYHLVLPLWCECNITHWGPGQASKGIEFSRRSPGTVVQSIDNPLGRPYPHEGKIYSRIDGEWYAWYEYSS